MKPWTPLAAIAILTASVGFVPAARAQQGQVNVICSVQADWCGAAAKQYQLPSSKATPVDANVLDFKKIKLIKYAYAKYGASAERRRLISRWEKDVNALPK